MKKAELPPLMKPIDALKRLEWELGGIHNAQITLAHKMRDGEVRTYAGYAWETGLLTVDRAWELGPSQDAEKRALVRPAHFEASSRWMDDIHLWDWRQGHFWITRDGTRTRRRRMMLKDVRFVAEDVEKVKNKALVAFEHKKHAGGRPSDRARWDAFWQAVVKMAVEGKLVDPKYAGVKKEILNADIYERSREFVDDPHPESTTLRVTRQKVWTQLVEPLLGTGRPGDESSELVTTD